MRITSDDPSRVKCALASYMMLIQTLCLNKGDLGKRASMWLEAEPSRTDLNFLAFRLFSFGFLGIFDARRLLSTYVNSVQ